jgi:glycosyltransferase involved in cell wall biosynthesis
MRIPAPPARIIVFNVSLQNSFIIEPHYLYNKVKNSYNKAYFILNFIKRRKPMNQPLVCIVTPVYNGEEFIREAIESVLAQTYKNWDYVIFNNCSTDRTLAIADSYAAMDSRIRVVTSERFLDIYDSFNASMRQISKGSKYCKPLHADDMLLPDCITQMVRLAEENPTAGVVGAYAVRRLNIVWDGCIPFTEQLISGHQICRDMFMGKPYVFGSPSSTMLRSDLVLKRQDFYNVVNPNPDFEACLDLLTESDFGFVHQVLTLTRLHGESQTTRSFRTGSWVFGRLVMIQKYGPTYLTKKEYKACMDDWLLYYLQTYLKFLAKGKLKAFREYHKCHFEKIGFRIKQTEILRIILKGIFSLRLKITNRGVLVFTRITIDGDQ